MSQKLGVGKGVVHGKVGTAIDNHLERKKMPNHCGNDLWMKFPTPEEAEAFVVAVESGESSLARTFMPMPEVLNGTRSPTPEGEFDPNGRFQAFVDNPADEHWTTEHYEEEKAKHNLLIEKSKQAFAETSFHNWYDWASGCWGTKWGDYDIQIEAFRSVVEASYTTAWGPLSDYFFETLSEKFPTAEILMCYEEPGMGFQGASSFFNGQCVFSESQEYRNLKYEAEFALDEAVDSLAKES